MRSVADDLREEIRRRMAALSPAARLDLALAPSDAPTSPPCATPVESPPRLPERSSPAADVPAGGRRAAMTSEHATLFNRIVVHLELAGGERDVDIVDRQDRVAGGRHRTSRTRRSTTGLTDLGIREEDLANDSRV